MERLLCGGRYCDLRHSGPTFHPTLRGNGVHTGSPLLHGIRISLRIPHTKTPRPSMAGEKPHRCDYQLRKSSSTSSNSPRVASGDWSLPKGSSFLVNWIARRPALTPFLFSKS